MRLAKLGNTPLFFPSLQNLWGQFGQCKNETNKKKKNKPKAKVGQYKNFGAKATCSKVWKGEKKDALNKQICMQMDWGCRAKCSSWDAEWTKWTYISNPFICFSNFQLSFTDRI